MGKKEKKTHPRFRLIANTIHASLMDRLYKFLQNKTDWKTALTCSMCLTDITAAGYA